MPRYVYRCDSCSGHFQVRHGMSERQEECTICNSKGPLVRVPQMPFVVNKEPQENKVGSTTQDFIEQNRQVLKEMKQEARSATYDD
jgi:putative FmdB family regulatory protein